MPRSGEASISVVHISADEVAAAALTARVGLSSKWQVRQALVIRARAAGPSDGARRLLETALEYKAVPKTLRGAYDETLTAIAEAGGLDDLVARLRD